MNDQSSCNIIVLYKINIAPWLMGAASAMLAPWHLLRFMCVGCCMMPIKY